MSLLSIQNVSSGYGKMAVLHGINIEVGTGEIVVVVGPNGAGKTTLMRTIFGLLRPATGQIQFDLTDIGGTDPSIIARSGIGYVPQGVNVFTDLTVWENMEVASLFLQDVKHRIEETLNRFSVLLTRRNQQAGTLSGGERQMLAIACAMMGTPKLLLLDEPSTGLAPKMTEAVLEKVLEINREGSAVIWVVEENPRRIIPHANRVYLLESGTIKREGNSREVLSDNFERLFLGINTEEMVEGKVL